MIKNIVFDLGNVLISFKPVEFFKKKNYPEHIITTIMVDIFNSHEWAMLDNGNLNTREAIDAIAAKSLLKREEIALIFNFRTELMFPLDENVKLLPELKKRGFKLYYLSNFPIDIFEEVKTGYYFFKYFEGGIISSEVKLSKPDVRIYESLLGKYHLKPGESLFIDDIENNVVSAKNAGMAGLHFNEKQNLLSQIEEVLDS